MSQSEMFPITNAQKRAIDNVISAKIHPSIKDDDIVHFLKTESAFFEMVVDGTKTAEIRKNDRDFWVLDWVILVEIDINPVNGKICHTGEYTTLQITSIFSDSRFLADGYVMLSFRKLV